MSQSPNSLVDLDVTDNFARRHIGPSEPQQQRMVTELGYSDLDAMIDAIIPANIRSRTALDLPAGLSETDALNLLRQIADRNGTLKSYIGLGYYNCVLPHVIQRNLLENPAWYTAYTPYQAEIAQGRLEALLNFQTAISDLTKLDVANASLLDEATAAAEAMAFCQRAGKSKSNRFFVADHCFPQTIDVVATRAGALDIELIVGPLEDALQHGPLFGLLLQYPDNIGAVHDLRALIAEAQAQGALVAMACDLLSLALLTPPGELGADVAIGSAQRFGVPLGFGGPHAGFFATREKFRRTMPGRIVGLSVDSDGEPALRLALQTREQHIRREKATSNICTAQALLAMIAGFYAAYHGPKGITRIARRVHHLTTALAVILKQQGITLVNDSFFDTLTLRTGDQTQRLIDAARRAGYNLRHKDDAHIGISLDQTTKPADIQALAAVFGAEEMPDMAISAIDAASGLPADLKRQSGFLEHPTFNSYHSETEMMRYLRTLSDKDLALDRAMIPLGSCTMKLNAAAELQPISWPEFANLHPYVPADQAAGYLQMIDELEQMLCRITGFDAFSFQPNAGSQGEFAGLMAIRRYHQAQGQGERRICLIPSSAHGTNPASAQMAGLDVVVVGCDHRGNIDKVDLEQKAEKHKESLAAIMITYPSTHGVFEETITEICDIVHRFGGQVYLDGANMNAMVGLCAPAEIGADVSHLNLHKTFCIPHGGGGPGIGPIGVKAHLKPYLPGHRGHSDPACRDGAVATAEYGSAGILPISWCYLKMMGGGGLTQATKVAILNANYIAFRLKKHFRILYTGSLGHVAHECIVDLRELKDLADISVDDVAKRLIDYGFHAPTMSWPVAGTLMIEPTESEPLVELDRFCDAMIAIREEIAAIEAGEADREDNLLRNAPHTALQVSADEWTHPYARQQAAYPIPALKQQKYWAPVGRIDNVYGDRNLVCACPPLSAYQDAAE